MSFTPVTLPLGNYDWIASPRCLSPGEEERKLIANRDKLRVFGEVNDVDACYSFCDYALVEFEGVYYLLNTQGCSCPSPEEEWRVDAKGTIDDMRRWLENDTYEWGMCVRQKQDFLDLFDYAASQP